MPAAFKSGVPWPQGAILGGGVLLAAVLYYVFDPADAGFFPRCPVLVATGLQCAGCGSQRAIHALLHGDLAAAWHFNPLLTVALPYVALGYLVEWRARQQGAWLRFRKTAYGTPAIYAVAVVLVVFTVTRNL